MGYRFLQYLNQIWVFCTIPLAFIILAVPPTLISIPFPIKIRLRIVSPFWRLFSLFSLRFCAWSTIYSEDHREDFLKSYPPQGLYIANHQSFLDIPLIMSQFQIPPVMKKEVLYIPIFGVMAWAVGALPVSRARRHSRKKVFVQARDRLVTTGLAVQYYPEGTRSRQPTPKAFEHLKVTLIHLAYAEQIPVIPVSLYGTQKVVDESRLIKTGQKLGIITHSSINPKDYPDATSFARASWEQVQAGHHQLKTLLEN